MNEALTRWLMDPEAPDAPVTLEDFLHRPEWHQRASCRGVGVEAFIIDRGRQYSRRELCETCPVRQECLEVALADESLQGMWGGTTEIGRRELRRWAAA